MKRITIFITAFVAVTVAVVGGVLWLDNPTITPDPTTGLCILRWSEGSRLERSQREDFHLMDDPEYRRCLFTRAQREGAVSIVVEFEPTYPAAGAPTTGEAFIENMNGYNISSVVYSDGLPVVGMRADEEALRYLFNLETVTAIREDTATSTSFGQ